MPEKTKKFLWMAAAVGVFALIVLGAAFLIFTPSKKSENTPFDLKGTAESRQDEPQDFLANPPETTIQQTTPSGDIIIVYGNNPETTATTIPKPSSTTIIVTPTQSPSTTLPPTTTTVPAVKPAPAKTATPTTVKPAPSTVPAPATPTTIPTKTAAPTTASGDFWIQAGSFRAKESADVLKASFKDKGLTATIAVKDISGKSYYQVRVGPYPSREEAKKWLGTVKTVPGASAEAFVTQ